MIIVLLLIMFTTLVNPMTGLIGAFISGLIVDIWTGSQIGFTAIAFLTISLLLSLYKRKFNPEHLIFLLPFTILVMIAIVWLQYQSLMSWKIALDTLLKAGTGIIVLWILVRLWQRRFGKETQTV